MVRARIGERIGERINVIGERIGERNAVFSRFDVKNEHR